MSNITSFPDTYAMRAAMRTHLTERYGTRPGVEVIEAGGGSRTILDFLADAHFTVVDISAEQLERNGFATRKICGDIQTLSEYPTHFDIAVVWDVAEHLDRPRQAFANLVANLKPGGSLVIAGPCPRSFKGLVTKATPHGVHVWFYRHFLGHKQAGEPGHAPFPTHLKDDVTLASLRRFAADEGLDIEMCGICPPTYVYERLRARALPGYVALRGLMGLLKVLSLGAWDPEKTDFLLVLKRPQEKAPAG